MQSRPIYRLVAPTLALAAGSLFAAEYADAECSAASAPDRQHLVELYTSEGCDSCPPAERWMSSLLKHPEIVGMEFHVTYWDSTDWRDPFDDAKFTKRQQALAKTGSDGQIYTPQIWLDGRLWHNWPKGAPPQPDTAVDAPLRMTVDIAQGVRATAEIDKPASEANFDLYLALTEDGLKSVVRGGENRGKTLAHDEVVRALSGPWPPPRAVADLGPLAPAEIDFARSSVVAFLQDRRDGNVAQVVRLRLSGCGK
jgi:hypothetical protein